MPSIEDYLLARKEAEAATARVKLFKRDLGIMAQALDNDPMTAAASVPGTWLPREDILQLLSDVRAAFSKAQALYRSLPSDVQPHVSAPPDSLR